MASPGCGAMARGINAGGGLLRFPLLCRCFLEPFPVFLPNMTCLRINFRVSWSALCRLVDMMNGIVPRTG